MYYSLLTLPAIAIAAGAIPNVRPSYDERKFHSKAIDDFIDQIYP